MADDLENIPASVADLVLILTAVLIEVVAETAADSKSADRALEAVANRLHDAGQRAGSARSRLVLSALAKQLMATEDGG